MAASIATKQAGEKQMTVCCRIFYHRAEGSGSVALPLPMCVMATITTRTGDDGTTGLLGPERVPKDDLRIEALGALDEAQSALGLARALASAGAGQRLLAIQRALYRLMGELSTLGQPDAEALVRTYDLATSAEQVAELEREIFAWREAAPSQFILPGSSPFDGALHLGRALVRRAERRVVSLQRQGYALNPETVRYLNRLSDWLYLFAQHEANTPPPLARERTRRVRKRSATSAPRVAPPSA